MQTTAVTNNEGELVVVESANVTHRPLVVTSMNVSKLKNAENLLRV